jgi:hypothetical protein
MNPQSKSGVLNFFFNLGAVIALGFVIGNFLRLMFVVIEKAYPTINAYNYGYYYGGTSISFPVASLIVVFPIYILFMWLLERSYLAEPEKKNGWFRKLLVYIMLFIAGGTFIGDLITVLYYFIDGQDLTSGFVLKALTILVVATGVFFYYVSDLMGRINSMSRKVWVTVVSLLILFAIIWGFSVLGSPRTQRLMRYDEQKITDLQNMNSQIGAYFSEKSSLPSDINELYARNMGYYSQPADPQTGKSYEYKLIGQSAKAYELCADFNSPTNNPKNLPYPNPYTDVIWSHPAGHYCFSRTIDISQYPGVKLPM